MDALTITDLLPSWERTLRARNRSVATIYSYLLSAQLLEKHVGQVPIVDIESQHVEAFIADQLATQAPGTAAVRYRSLKQFFRWALEEDEIERSPMAGMKPPYVPEAPVPIIPDDALRRLFAVCGPLVRCSARHGDPSALPGHAGSAHRDRLSQPR
jgi:integrase/recombinase XerC